MKTIVVTGGSGYIGGFVIAEFLNNGYAVRTSLRNTYKLPAIKQYLQNFVDVQLLDNLTAFQADLVEEANWLEHIKGTDGVIHVASPLGTGRESEKELTEISVGGTINVLNAAYKTGVKRVVFTSSLAACTPTKDVGDLVLDEKFWTDIKNPEIDAYRKSKVASEQAAWEFAEKNGLQLSTILPGAVFGHTMSKDSISSNQILLSLINGSLPKAFNIPLETVDVEDLARLHRLAFEQDVAIGERYLAASQTIMMPEVAKLFKANYPKCHTPSKTFNNRTVKLLSLFITAIRSMVPMIGREYTHTTAKAEKQLGWIQITPEQTVLNATESFDHLGLIK